MTDDKKINRYEQRTDGNCDPSPIRISVTAAGARSPRRRKKRLSIDLAASEHRALKARAATVGLSMRVLVVKALRREGVLGRSKTPTSDRRGQKALDRRVQDEEAVTA